MTMKSSLTQFPLAALISFLGLVCARAQTPAPSDPVSLAEVPSPPPAPLVTPTPPPAAPATNEIEALEDGARLPAGRVPELIPSPPAAQVPERYGGLVGQAIESGRPWQLFNPLAPAEYGDGTQHLSVNPVTGRAEGLTLISFQFKPKWAGKKPRREAVAPR